MGRASDLAHQGAAGYSPLFTVGFHWCSLTSQGSAFARQQVNLSRSLVPHGTFRDPFVLP